MRFSHSALVVLCSFDSCGRLTRPYRGARVSDRIGLCRSDIRHSSLSRFTELGLNARTICPTAVRYSQVGEASSELVPANGSRAPMRTPSVTAVSRPLTRIAHCRGCGGCAAI